MRYLPTVENNKVTCERPKQPRSSFCIRLLAFLSFLLLSACATVPSASLADPNAQIPEDAGVVAVQVVSNAVRISSAIRHWEEVVVVRVSDRKIFTIPATGSGFVSTRAFVGALSPGEYAIISLFSQRHTSDFVYTMRASVPRMVGRFEVKQGQLTNLGTLIFQPFDEARNEQKSIDYLVSRIPDSSKLIELVQKQFPREYSQLTTTESLGWLPDKFGPIRNAVSKQVRRNALASIIEADESNDSFWFLGRLGQVYHRNKQGRWSRKSIKTPYQLTTITQLTDGSTIAGGERGSLFKQNPRTKKWSALPFPDSSSNLIDLGQFPQGDIYALSEHADEFRLSRSTDGRNWSLAAQFKKQEPGWLAKAYNFYTVSFPYSVQKGNELEIWVDEKHIVYNAQKNSIQEKPALEFSRLKKQGNGILIGRQYSSWSGEKNPQYSRDGGNTWKSIKLGEGLFSSAVGIPYVFSDGSLIKTGSAKQFKLFGDGWVEKDQIPILGSSDDGQTWQPVGALPKRCDDLSHAASTNSMLVTICRDGRILSSIDRGLSWKHEFGAAPKKSHFPEIFSKKPE